MLGSFFYIDCSASGSPRQCKRLQTLQSIVAAIALSVCLSYAHSANAQSSVATPSIRPQPVSIEKPTYQDFLNGLGIVGYSRTISVRPGAEVEIKVSTKAPTKYKAELVRIIHGDADPNGPGIKEVVIDTKGNGVYDGKFQPLIQGSYVDVPASNLLDLTSSFTITAWIAPTTIPGSNLNPLARGLTPVGMPRPQGIVSKWDEKSASGYGLFIDVDGSLALWVGSSGKVEKISTGVKMNPWTPGNSVFPFASNIRTGMSNFTTWYFVAASYDAAKGTVTLYQEPQKGRPNPTRAVVERRLQGAPTKNGSSLLIGAGWKNADKPGMGGLFNGKIDGPKLFGRALSADEINGIRQGKSSSNPVAAWNFAKEFSEKKIVDDAGGHNGMTVNNPVKAVTGHNWQPGEMNFNHAPQQFGALHFHEDDISDANWDTSLTVKIPAEAKSGLYGVRLTAGENIYHVTFTVLPKAGSHTKVAFLVPTFSYLAYAGGVNVGGQGQYDKNYDGSGVVYSSWDRPIFNMRPYATGRKGEGRAWQYEADTHITDWLDHEKIEVDYITDHDVHNDPAILKPYKVVLTGTHPEYISDRMLSGIRDYLGNGGRLMYLAGNGFYWVTSLGRDGRYTELRRHDGTEAYQMPAGEYYHNTTGEFGGLWRFRGVAPQEVVGVGFTAQGFNGSRPYMATPAAKSEGGSWVFDGVDISKPIGEFPNLQLVGGPAGEEVDRADYALGTPATSLVLAQATNFPASYNHVVEEVNTSTDQTNGTVNDAVRADMTLTYYPNGGAVWTPASMIWSGSFFYNNYQNDITKITRNVLDKFASGAPLPAAPVEQK